MENANTAQGNARVDNQIGVVHGDANFYKISDESTPEEKFAVGLNYLNGHMPRQAEKLIREAVMSGFSPVRGSYYWTLAILSGKSFDHLSEEEFNKLQGAWEKALPADLRDVEDSEWATTLKVIIGLIRSLLSQERDPDAEPVEFSASFELYEKLPKARKDEIRRHLEMMLVGRIQDEIAARDAAEVATLRMSRDREKRAGLFFEEEPAQPRKLRTGDRRIRPSDALMCTGGIILICMSLHALLMYNLPWRDILLCILFLIIATGGLTLGAWSARDWLRLTAKMHWQEARVRGPHGILLDGGVLYEDRDGNKRVDFRTGVRQWVDAYFKHLSPSADIAATHWRRDTKGIRESLTQDIIRQYEGAYPASANAVEWLIRKNARKILAEWNSGDLLAFTKPSPLPKKALVWGSISALIVATALLALAAEFVLTMGTSGVRGGILLWIGISVGLIGLIRLYASLCRHSIEKDELEARYQAELAEYDSLTKSLTRRPSDAEMAAWLDYDKSHIMALALKGYQLANRDVIAHVTLTEAAEQSRRARVIFGPPRYSNYNVRIFLLTDTGVRQFVICLDSETGTLSDERRSAFRYDSITSAAIMEVGVRMNGSKRQIVDLGSLKVSSEDDKKDSKDSKDRVDKLTFAQAFQLSLNNSSAINVLVENFDEGLIDKVRENSKHLMELARDTSGISAAVRILEAVAAEGREWVAQERARRRRRWAYYQRSQLISQIAIDSGTQVDFTNSTQLYKAPTAILARMEDDDRR